MNLVTRIEKKYDAIVIGAGPVGCVTAERMAKEMGWQVLMIDKREHIAGNCYDMTHPSGVMIHRYGPHYFRTNKQELVDYLGQYTEWIPGNYIVKSSVNGELYPFPINLDTLRQFFKQPGLTAETAEALLESKRFKIPQPANSQEFVLSRVGEEMYKAFYLGYTLKQWAIHPKDLAASVCGRIPVRMNTDDRYVDHKFQLTPAAGFTSMFRNMISQPGIDVMLNTDFNDVRKDLHPGKVLVYTGPIDEYFDHKLGKLPWRSLHFEFKEKEQEYTQPCVQINYPNEHDYTRTVEIKHVTGQKHPKTVISYEYPRAEGDPYYPIPMDENAALYARYREMAGEETQQNNVYFCGRLAEYKYYNTDEVIELALGTFNTIKNKYGNK